MRRGGRPMAAGGLGIALLSLLLPGRGLARDVSLPCVQRLAPAMIAAQVWNGPALDRIDLETIDPDVSQLVQQTTDLGLDQATLAATLETFAVHFPDRVAIAAAATFARLQAMRDATLDAIRIAARQQRQRLDAIDQHVEHLRGLAEDAPDRGNLMATVDWNRRQLEAGRRMMTGLCERPGRIEARFAQIAHVWEQRN